MRRFLLLAMLVPVACDGSASSLCGDGEEVSADGTRACLYSAELIEEGFQCPPEVSIRTELEDGAVVCSGEQPLPPEIAEQLEAQGYDAASGGTTWALDEPPGGPENPSNPPRDASNDPRLLGTLIDRDQGEPLDAARVCILDAQPEVCTTTDAQGQFVLQIAPNSEYALTAELAGYHPRILPMRAMAPASSVGTASDVILRGWGLRTVRAEAALLATAGVAQAEGLGIVSIDADASGAVATLEPGGDEGWYVDGASLVRSSTGTARPQGSIYFPNLEPGEYTASITAADLRCEAEGWAGAANNVVRVPVRAGFITNPLGVQCR